MRRLERVYGAEAVRAEYDQLKTVELGQPVQIADMSQSASSLIRQWNIPRFEPPATSPTADC